MEKCSICEKTSNDLSECEICAENVCPDCSVDVTYNNFVDFPLCNDCNDIVDRINIQ